MTALREKEYYQDERYFCTSLERGFQDERIELRVQVETTLTVTGGGGKE